jgi:hypothetical protein
MKSFDPSVLIAAVIILASAFVLVQGGALSTRRDVIQVGGLRVSTESRYLVSPWIAGIGLAIGTTVLLFRGSRAR